MRKRIISLDSLARRGYIERVAERSPPRAPLAAPGSAEPPEPQAAEAEEMSR
jgi:hypothetical protein